MKVQDIVTIDNDIQFGTPVFKDTRVPLVSLFIHLEKGYSIREFTDSFPSVTKEQCEAALGLAEKIFGSKNLDQLYEIAA